MSKIVVRPSQGLCLANGSLIISNQESGSSSSALIQVFVQPLLDITSPGTRTVFGNSCSSRSSCPSHYAPRRLAASGVGAWPDKHHPDGPAQESMSQATRIYSRQEETHRHTETLSPLCGGPAWCHDLSHAYSQSTELDESASGCKPRPWPTALFLSCPIPVVGMPIIHIERCSRRSAHCAIR